LLVLQQAGVLVGIVPMAPMAPQAIIPKYTFRATTLTTMMWQAKFS
jgi:hypothetical protein